MSFSIRPAELADLDTIIDFNQRMAMETEGKSLNPGIIRHGVLAVLGDPAKGAYHLASGEQGTVGQMMITWEWSDWRNGNFWWIQSVYVRPEQRGKKVFSMLYRHVERLGREESGCCGLRLYVERDNIHARGVYTKLGMMLTRYDLMEREF